MPSRKEVFIKKTLFIILNYLIINAVMFTALILYSNFSSFPEWRIIMVLLNISMIPCVVLLTPILTERTLFQDKTIAITVRSVTAGMVVFVALMWIAGIFALTIAQIVVIYISLIFVETLAMVLLRFFIKNSRKKGEDLVNVLIIGSNITAGNVENELLKNKEYGYNVIGHIGEDHGNYIMKTERLGDLSSLEDIVARDNIQQIYFISESESDESLTHIFRLAKNNFADLFIVPAVGQFTHRKFTISDNSLGLPSLSFKEDRLMNPWNRAIKRSFDIVFAFVSLVVLAVPVFLPVAIAVKLSSPGPVFFKQKRNGYHGKEFTCYKFRSMVVNKDCDDKLTSRDDERITKVGNFLRHTSLDELPQFWNVLIGNMSVVGPRPHMIRQTDQYRQLIDDYMIRHVIKPGITGWAQINKLRGTTESHYDMSRRVKADIWYIDNWTLALDIKIIVRTIYNIIFTHEEHAY